MHGISAVKDRKEVPRKKACWVHTEEEKHRTFGETTECKSGRQKEELDSIRQGLWKKHLHLDLISLGTLLHAELKFWNLPTESPEKGFSLPFLWADCECT